MRERRKISLGVFLAVLALAASGLGLAQEQKERQFRECPDCPEMVGIPAGKFVMGSPASEAGRFDTEGPQHVVTISAFALGKYDITSRQFLGFLRATHYQPMPCNSTLGMGWHSARGAPVYSPEYGEPPKWPAVCLDWRDADAYIAWLNAKVRRLRPELTSARGPYRLPTEAEWEYAARAGTATARWWGDAIGTNRTNCNGCGSRWDDKLLADVDSFAPNPFGLYGMLGNAWQWTADCWHINYKGAPTDGSAWVEKNCTRRVIRGGSWDNLPVFVRSASRSGSVTDGGEYDYSSLTGFRVARDLP
ncbi:MAG TPA: formylglycine-generating enzyme family protein [Bradyrhizobium sp.]|nr:formylglycine-generating enzyme family protein [Bradyrhizobium sp.]